MPAFPGGSWVDTNATGRTTFPLTTLTVDIPANDDGDLLLLLAWQGDPDETTLTLPAGFTEDARFTVNGEMSAVFAHRIAASEPFTPYSVGFAGTSPQFVMVSSWADHSGIIDSVFLSGVGATGTFGPGVAVGGAGWGVGPIRMDRPFRGTFAALYAVIDVGTGGDVGPGVPDPASGFNPAGGITTTGGPFMVGVESGGGLIYELVDVDPSIIGPYDFPIYGTDLGWVSGLWSLGP